MEDNKDIVPINRAALSATGGVKQPMPQEAVPTGAKTIFAGDLPPWDLMPPLMPIKRIHRAIAPKREPDKTDGNGAAGHGLIESQSAPTFEPSPAAQEPVTASAPAPQEPISSSVQGTAAPVAPSLYDVVLDARGRNVIQVIKVVRELTNMGLKDAKDLVDRAPSVVAHAISDERASRFKAALEEQGAAVSLRQHQ